MGDLEVGELIAVLRTLKELVAASAAGQILQVLLGMEDMGLGYLSLNRPSGTLSGGESQRLRILRHLGSSLTGLLYILDEPSSGLHPKDIARLGRLLLHLRDRGNTVLVVEHNTQIIGIADHVVDMGPYAGAQGGRIVFEGTPEALLSANTLTAESLRRRTVPKSVPRTPTDYFCMENAVLHNLRDVSVRIPKGVLAVVSGVAGAGKSSLICGALLQQHPQAVHISQLPIGTGPRSTPATYVGIMNDIRRLFAQENGVDAAWFSHNSKGACTLCKGKGVIKTEMAFMDPVEVVCEACGGVRYGKEALEYRYRGKNIVEALEMTAQQAMEFFDHAGIQKKLDTLCQVGMGYIRLGQPTDTLSGGECQRIKLAAHLHKKNALYVLDEPTTGLHGSDTERLLKLLDDLVDRGNSVIVIEHDLDVICHADWVIDMGPEGGGHGGQILFEGTPEALLRSGGSATAEYLRYALDEKMGNPRPGKSEPN